MSRDLKEKMTPNGVRLEDLPPDTRRKLGLASGRTTTFTLENVRARAINVLDEISDLTREERRRILEQAMKINKV